MALIFDFNLETGPQKSRRPAGRVSWLVDICGYSLFHRVLSNVHFVC